MQCPGGCQREESVDPGGNRLHISQSLQSLQEAGASVWRCVPHSHSVFFFPFVLFTSWLLNKSNPVCPDSRVESLQLTMTEVLKRQCSKSKKGHHQVNYGFYTCLRSTVCSLYDVHTLHLDQRFLCLNLSSLHIPSLSTSQCHKRRWTRSRWTAEVMGRLLPSVWTRMRRSSFRGWRGTAHDHQWHSYHDRIIYKQYKRLIGDILLNHLGKHANFIDWRLFCQTELPPAA